MDANTLYRTLAVVALIAIGVHRVAAMHRPVGVDAYQARVRDAAAAAPTHVGAWVGTDIPVPAQAINVLAPNAIVSRRYVNVETGVAAGVLLVHCSDAHDMAGHFPLRCYPARGWSRQGGRARDWSVDGLTLAGTEYRFEKPGGLGQSAAAESIVVANCLFRPDGKTLRDMDALAAAVVGAGGQALGAGQIQICFDAAVPEADRDDAVRALAGGYRVVIDAMLSKVPG